jgi:hypothetical protein
MIRALTLLAVLANAAQLFAVCPSIQWTTQHEEANDVTYIERMIAFDYDRDGKQDLLEYDYFAVTLYARRGIGDGTFEAPITVAHSGVFAAGDVDGDGDVDVVVVTSQGLAIVPGTGSGFGTQGPISPQPSIRQVAIGNFDGDPGLEVLTWSSFDELTVYDYAGEGLVAAQQVRLGGFFRDAWHIADFDGDGRQDVLFSNSYGYGICYRTADGRFSPEATFGDYSARNYASGDVNGDGRL